jgi:hypothetical protein
MFTQSGLPPNPPAGRNGAGEHRVELSAAGACLTRCLMCPSHLSQDLGFTHNLGVETGRDLTEVSNAGNAIPSNDRRARLDPPRARKLVKPRLEVIAAGPVDLESVAGGEDGGAAAGGPLLIQPGGCLGRRENQLFSHPHRSRTIGHPDDMKGVQGR